MIPTLILRIFWAGAAAVPSTASSPMRPRVCGERENRIARKSDSGFRSGRIVGVQKARSSIAEVLAPHAVVAFGVTYMHVGDQGFRLYRPYRAGKGFTGPGVTQGNGFTDCGELHGPNCDQEIRFGKTQANLFAEQGYWCCRAKTHFFGSSGLLNDVGRSRSRSGSPTGCDWGRTRGIHVRC